MQENGLSLKPQPTANSFNLKKKKKSPERSSLLHFRIYPKSTALLSSIIFSMKPFPVCHFLLPFCATTEALNQPQTPRALQVHGCNPCYIEGSHASHGHWRDK